MEPAAGKDKTLGEHIRVVGSPAARLIGFEVPESGGGRAAVTLQAGPQHANPMGTIHGGILCDIADAAMGIAFSSTLEPGETGRPKRGDTANGALLVDRREISLCTSRPIPRKESESKSVGLFRSK